MNDQRENSSQADNEMFDYSLPLIVSLNLSLIFYENKSFLQVKTITVILNLKSILCFLNGGRNS